MCARTYDNLVVKFKNRDGKREFKRWKWGWKGRRVERKERNKETELEKEEGMTYPIREKSKWKREGENGRIWNGKGK